ncbi:MAG TPA: nuclear transport factor 2 family protein [Ktedonobacteraceae bacterium]|jgi:predicted ester cyclase
MASDAHRTIAECWMDDVFVRGDMEALDELLASEFISTDLSGRVGAQGVEAFKKWLRWYRSSFTDAEWTIHELLEEGENVVLRYAGRTTSQGGLLDIPSKKQRVTEMGILIFRIREGKITEEINTHVNFF